MNIIIIRFCTLDSNVTSEGSEYAIFVTLLTQHLILATC